MTLQLESIIKRFQIYGDLKCIEPYGSGHINTTYRVTFDQGGRSVCYILQRINHRVFPDARLLMKNFMRVTHHIRRQLRRSGTTDMSRRVLTAVPTRQGEMAHWDEEGTYWRALIFIDEAQTFDALPSLNVAFEAARAFGAFQSALLDLPDPPLDEVLADFHNGPKRHRDFTAVLEADPGGRVASAGPAVDFVARHADLLTIFPSLIQKGDIPLRIVHNDTKINNVMIDAKTGKGLCVIDLDTVMPGLTAYDFGDLMRTALSPTTEDEKDLNKIHVEMDRFDAIVRGYLSSAGHFLTGTELEHLVTGGKVITFMMGLRFLTDYLNGDQYYRIQYPQHNLDRCRAQFQLLESILQHEEQMQQRVRQYYRQSVEV